MNSRQMIDAFRRPPKDERESLIEALWDEVERELEGQALSEPHRRLLDERLHLHEENPADVESWEAARDDLLRNL